MHRFTKLWLGTLVTLVLMVTASQSAPAAAAAAAGVAERAAPTAAPSPAPAAPTPVPATKTTPQLGGYWEDIALVARNRFLGGYWEDITQASLTVSPSPSHSALPATLAATSGRGSPLNPFAVACIIQDPWPVAHALAASDPVPAPLKPDWVEALLDTRATTLRSLLEARDLLSAPHRPPPQHAPEAAPLKPDWVEALLDARATALRAMLAAHDLLTAHAEPIG
jgi:hypothetical protein